MDSLLNIDTSSDLPISDSFQDTDNLKPEVPIHHEIDKVYMCIMLLVMNTSSLLVIASTKFNHF